jgi:uncharacterized protein HemX
MKVGGVVLHPQHIGKERRVSSEREREQFREENNVPAEVPKITVSVNGLAQAIVLASILGFGGYVWSTLQRVPPEEVLKKQAVDLERLKVETATTSVRVDGVNESLGRIEAQLRDIERLLRKKEPLP